MCMALRMVQQTNKISYCSFFSKRYRNTQRKQKRNVMWLKLLWQDCVGSYRLSQSWLQLKKKLVVFRDSIGRWKANKSRFWKREWKWKEKIQKGRLEYSLTIYSSKNNTAKFLNFMVSFP